MRTLKVVGVLVVLAAIGLVGFAYFGNLSPIQQQVSIPVELNAN